MLYELFWASSLQACMFLYTASSNPCENAVEENFWLGRTMNLNNFFICKIIVPVSKDCWHYQMRFMYVKHGVWCSYDTRYHPNSQICPQVEWIRHDIFRDHEYLLHQNIKLNFFSLVKIVEEKSARSLIRSIWTIADYKNTFPESTNSF